MSADLAAALQRLYALSVRGMDFGLDRVLDAARRLGDVHRFSIYAHVGGTNGKGSTSAFLATMGRIAGAKVGLYTSPHLCRFAERIRREIAAMAVMTGNVRLKITASVGLAVWDRRETAEDFYRRADRQLYEAKRQGRNRVCA